ncbi:uncharacterized protein LOC131617094 [Vicia villosa]|uniref:uncharacterized protein LOC131617094 n=1 Tax=Vicia villosa TaxID=3911 RepID=UPI00273BEE34|nr:uncharacterized protein LOC131617094 [Vicia villosa]
MNTTGLSNGTILKRIQPNRKMKLESPSEQLRLLSEIPKVISEMVDTREDSSKEDKLEQNDLSELAIGENCSSFEQYSIHDGFARCLDKLTNVVVTTQEPNILVGVNSPIVQQLSYSAKIWKVYSKKGKIGTHGRDLGLEKVYSRKKKIGTQKKLREGYAF